MERPLVTAVTHSLGDARITLTGLPDRPGIAGKVLTALADANVNVDDIIQNEPVSADHRADMSFTVPKEDVHAANVALDGIKDELGIGRIEVDEHIGKVSLIGAGMKTHPGVAAKAFRTLGDKNVNIEMIVTSPIKISCVIHENDVGKSVRALHTAFGLDEPGAGTGVPS